MASSSNLHAAPSSDRSAERPSERPTERPNRRGLKGQLVRLLPRNSRAFVVTGDFDPKALEEFGPDAPIRSIEDLRIRDAEGPGFIHAKTLENAFNDAMVCAAKADDLGLSEDSPERVAFIESGYVVLVAKRIENGVAMTVTISLPPSTARGQDKQAIVVRHELPVLLVTDLLKTVHQVRALLERYAEPAGFPGGLSTQRRVKGEAAFFDTWGIGNEEETEEVEA